MLSTYNNCILLFSFSANAGKTKITENPEREPGKRCSCDCRHIDFHPNAKAQNEQGSTNNRESRFRCWIKYVILLEWMVTPKACFVSCRVVSCQVRYSDCDTILRDWEQGRKDPPGDLGGASQPKIRGTLLQETHPTAHSRKRVERKVSSTTLSHPMKELLGTNKHNSLLQTRMATTNAYIRATFSLYKQTSTTRHQLKPTNINDTRWRMQCLALHQTNHDQRPRALGQLW
jgi:hypothetical protein